MLSVATLYADMGYGGLDHNSRQISRRLVVYTRGTGRWFYSFVLGRSGTIPSARSCTVGGELKISLVENQKHYQYM